MTMKKLFIIDTMAMAFRSYHAFGARQLTTASGVPTSALYGSAQFLLRLINEESPHFLVAATDTKAPTFRHKLYEPYKANRSAMPDDLAVQIPKLYEMLKSLGIPTIICPGYEADDIIGTIVTRFATQSLQCVIVSGDKDLMQLVDKHVIMHRPKKGGQLDIVDESGVVEKLGCRPDQVIDLLSIVGDRSDNIPGVKGIGEKGAAQLIANHSTLDHIYGQLDSVKNPGHRRKLEADREMAFLSKRLVTIDRNVPLDVDLDDLIFDPTHLHSPELIQIFEDLEFGQLLSRLEARHSPADRAPDGPQELDKAEDLASSLPAVPAVQVALANTPETIRALCQHLDESKTFAFDCHTTELQRAEIETIGISFATEAGRATYVPLLENQLRGLQTQNVIDRIKQVLEKPACLKVTHDLKRTYAALKRLAIKPVGPLSDCMMMSFLLSPNSKAFDLEPLARSYLGVQKTPLAALVGPKNLIAATDLPLMVLAEFSCQQADISLRLQQLLQPQLDAAGLTKLYEDIELPLVEVLATMESEGILVDRSRLQALSIELKEQSARLEQEIHALAGEPFNIQSPKQLQVILFEKLKVHEQLGKKRLKKTKSGYSTDVTVLESLADHPICRSLLEYRTVSKLLNTYVETLPDLISNTTGRIHTSFNQTGAATGRLSSTNPNLQNIPIRTDIGKQVRNAFVARDGWVLMSADYSQVELRILAHLSGDEALKGVFASKGDVHKMTAAKIFQKTPDTVTAEERSRAKAVNYGIVYGMGAQKLAKTISVSHSEAKEFIEKYFATFPGIQSFIERCISSAREAGVVRTLTGRMRPLEGLDGEQGGLAEANAKNIAVNTPIQGTAADVIKLAMIRIAKRIADENMEAKLLLQVHDELVLECPVHEQTHLEQIVRLGMEEALPLAVRLETTVGSGQNWLEAH